MDAREVLGGKRVHPGLVKCVMCVCVLYLYTLRVYGGSEGLAVPSILHGFLWRFTLLMLVAATELNLSHKI